MLEPLTRFLVFAAVVLIGGPLVIAEQEPAARLVRSAAPDWPQWRGPHRNGICEGKGPLDSWPDDGPNREWTISGIGRSRLLPSGEGTTQAVRGRPAGAYWGESGLAEERREGLARKDMIKTALTESNSIAQRGIRPQPKRSLTDFQEKNPFETRCLGI